MLNHCHLGGTLINTVEVDGIQLADVDVRVQNTWHVTAWVIPAWVKVVFQVTHVDHHLRLRRTCNSQCSRGVPATKVKQPITSGDTADNL